ncbi:hypothetical protein IAG44_26255 [Streptomyces roseirectus]|uniref:Uncharacterized protein n=1 Tax=Streptomyces roseirectus TaxID=2768066 RepID=A0A7H0IIG7_9ACTN|nr:hypothetical protein [Streptomyces roseirectus]QNP72583.1 hypothetical protein IAG44_26255 [Streptomyces roseirectus]
MSTEERGFQVGDVVNVYGGSGNVGKIQNTYQSAGDPQAAFREMLAAVQVLRERVSSEDRETIDASLRVIGEEGAEPGVVRRALTAIVGVAAVVGEVGVPVVEAVRRVLGG